jgi:hypothetical protein
MPECCCRASRLMALLGASGFPPKARGNDAQQGFKKHSLRVTLPFLNQPSHGVIAVKRP